MNSELDTWHRTYLPVKGTVLDVGAGCGETAFFYLMHGASHVIAVESDSEAVRLLHENFDGDNRVTIVQRRVDHVKLDIEGSEEGMVIETHGFTPSLSLIRYGGEQNIWRLTRTKMPVRGLTLKRLRVRLGLRTRVGCLVRR